MVKNINDLLKNYRNKTMTIRNTKCICCKKIMQNKFTDEIFFDHKHKQISDIIFPQTANLCSSHCKNRFYKILIDNITIKNLDKKTKELPLRFRDKTLENYKNINPKILEYISRENPNSLLLTGKSGTGKTHLAIGLYKKIILKNKTVKFIPFIEMIHEIKNSINTDINSKIDSFTKYDYLIIDDLGSEKTTDWIKEILYLIFDRIYREMRNVIITTNMTSSEMSERYDYKIVSRFSEMGYAITFNGKDYRINTMH